MDSLSCIRILFFFLNISGVTATPLRFLDIRLCRAPGRGDGVTKHMQYGPVVMVMMVMGIMIKIIQIEKVNVYMLI